MEENKEQRLKPFFISTAMFFLTLIAVGCSSYFRGNDIIYIVRNLVMSGIGVGTLLFLMAQSNLFSLYDYDNQEHDFRFAICFLLSLVLSVVCGYFPAEGWPYVAVFLLLSLFSNTVIGITAGMVLLIISILISGAGVDIFCLYGISGIACACLFRKLDDSYKVGIPLFVSLGIVAMSLTANIVLLTNEKMRLELFIVPFMNLFVTGFLLVIILKIFSSLVIFKYRDKYMEINDPECELLVQLKEYSKDEYYKAVHTAYFCDRIARKLSLDADAVKACGYYHNIGKLKGGQMLKAIQEICEEYEFPAPVRTILNEYLDKNKKIKKKETAVLLFSDAMITSILFLFSKDAKADLDYGQVIETVFRKKIESQVLSECEITMQEINTMKKIFKEEQLYYDFLR